MLWCDGSVTQNRGQVLCSFFVLLLAATARILAAPGIGCPRSGMPWVGQTACKPGSVSDRTGRMTTIHLGRPLPDASRDQPGRRGRKGPCNNRSRCLSPLLGLAPGGVCRAAAVAGSAVRSYRTLSPLPAGPKPGGRFAFCGTFPGVAPAGYYPAPFFRGARTFLQPALTRRPAAVQPSGPRPR